MDNKKRVIYGPPGTGKSTELIERAKWHVARNDSVHIVSYTKAGADEIASRVRDTVKNRGLVTASTVHATCFRHLNLSRDMVFSGRHLNDFFKSINIPYKGVTIDDDAKTEIGDEYLSVYSYSRAWLVNPMEAYTLLGAPGTMAEFEYFMRSYKSAKEQRHFIDFHDMLDDAHQVGVDIGSKVLMVDEAQDLSKAQWRLIDDWGADRWCHVAGDDDQAVHEWAGAFPAGMAQWQEKFEAKPRVLEQSWRVPRLAHELANSVISRVSSRVDKVYRPRDHDGRIARENLLIPKPVGPDTLYLYRDHFHRKDVEAMLIDENVPYRALTGFPGFFNSPQTHAVRLYHRLRRGEEVAKSDIEKVLKYTVEPFKKIIEGGIYKALPQDWTKAITATIVRDWRWHTYVSNVDLEAEPKVRISTIHGSKGRESEHVVLYNSIGKRAWDSYSQNPDSELRVFYVAVTRTKNLMTIVDGENPFEI